MTTTTASTDLATRRAEWALLQAHGAWRDLTTATATLSARVAAGQTVGGFELEAVMDAQSDWELFAAALWITGRDGRTWAQALNLVAERCRRDLLSDRFRGASTSAAHNAFDGAQRAAAARFLDHFSAEEL